jgi:hypothetical protein
LTHCYISCGCIHAQDLIVEILLHLPGKEHVKIAAHALCETPAPLQNAHLPSRTNLAGWAAAGRHVAGTACQIPKFLAFIPGLPTPFCFLLRFMSFPGCTTVAKSKINHLKGKFQCELPNRSPSVSCWRALPWPPA